MHVLLRNMLALLPSEEQTKQNKWLDSVSKYCNGFVNDVERWMAEAGKLA